MLAASSAVVIAAMLALGATAQVSQPPEEPSPAASSSEMPGISDGDQAFLDGYRAYTNRDFVRAIERLRYAADNSSSLTDYALYYLGLARRDQGDLAGAVDVFDRLLTSYPQSVNADRAELERADALLKLGRNSEAAAAAARLVARVPEGAIEPPARLIEARALFALHQPRDAYDRAMALREKYPRSASDADARQLAYAVLTDNPGLEDRESLEYRKREAGLLLREGEPALALAEVQPALAASPSDAVRAELLWIEARALRSDRDRELSALRDYLRLVPGGPSAPQALEALALIYWHDNDTPRARATFAKLVAEFPHSPLAPSAMLRIGRIFEEEHKFDSARSEYTALLARYPSGGEAADEAKFRAPWNYYLAHRYKHAAAAFAAAAAHASSSERDMYDYWRARALEKGGDAAAAHALYERIATSIDSNYYPALAKVRVDAPDPVLPAAAIAPPVFGPPPAIDGAPRFHLERALKLRALGLRELEAPELRTLESTDAGNRALGTFLLAAFQDAGAWRDAIETARRMEQRGMLGHDFAERVRYPRAWWDQIESLSGRRGLDRYMVLALMRQESLFDPTVTSSADAQGLMQLLPSLARRMATDAGLPSADLNLYDPALNMELGTLYLKKLMAKYDGNEFRAVAAYNAGEAAVAHWVALFPMEDDEWVENIGYRETREYVKQVIGGMREYRLLYKSAGATA
jgi:peptidoglycan lytic transglycosylase